MARRMRRQNQVNPGAENLSLRKRKSGKGVAGAELRSVSWVVAEEKFSQEVLEGMWGCLRRFGKGARVRPFEREGRQNRIKGRDLNRRTILGITRAIAGLADAMLLREKGWHAWRSGGLTLFLR